MAKIRTYVEPSKTPYFFFFILVLAIFGIVQLVRAASGGISGAPGTRYDGAQATDYKETTSSSYEDMPNMSVSFSTTAHSPAVILVSASSPSLRFAGCGYFMRLLVDGAVQSGEVPVLLSDRDSRSFNFVSQPLTPGSHTATIQWRIEMPYFASTGCVQARSLAVMHQ